MESGFHLWIMIIILIIIKNDFISHDGTSYLTIVTVLRLWAFISQWGLISQNADLCFPIATFNLTRLITQSFYLSHNKIYFIQLQLYTSHCDFTSQNCNFLSHNVALYLTWLHVSQLRLVFFSSLSFFYLVWLHILQLRHWFLQM